MVLCPPASSWRHPHSSRRHPPAALPGHIQTPPTHTHTKTQIAHSSASTNTHKHYRSHAIAHGPQAETFVGAHDSAIPCALLLDLAETLTAALAAAPRAEAGRGSVSPQFVFFDGEEAFVQWCVLAWACQGFRRTPSLRRSHTARLASAPVAGSPQSQRMAVCYMAITVPAPLPLVVLLDMG